MTAYVLDASVLSKWFLPEKHAEPALRLRRGDVGIMVPAFALLEVAQVLWKWLQRREMEPEQVWRALTDLQALPLQWLPIEPLVEAALHIAVSQRRSVYDSLYVALAVQQDCALVTADRRLYNALAAGPLAGYLLWVEDVPA